MKIYTLTPAEIEKYRFIITRFMKRFGDNRVTHKALRWFNQLQADTLPPGTYVAAALENRKIVGIIVFGEYGLKESFIAVHPHYRKQGIGEKLLNSAIQTLEKVYTRVACDNIASLKLCFHCGLVAFKLTRGPTGKPTLWLGGGKYDPSELPKEKKPLT